MKFQFPNLDAAKLFCQLVDNPDELDVACWPEDDMTVEILGLDDHEIIAPQLKRLALLYEAIEIK
jgi:hypothetical protein